MIIVNDLKPGTSFEYEGNLYQVLNLQLNKTAMRQMIVKVKVKNLRTGVINELSFTGGDKVEQAHIDKKEMQAALTKLERLHPVRPAEPDFLKLQLFFHIFYMQSCHDRHDA